MRRTVTIVVIFVIVGLLPCTVSRSKAQAGATKPSKPTPSKQRNSACEATCYAYRQGTRDERAEAERDGYRFLSPLDLRHPAIAAHIKVLDLHANYTGAIDDRLWLDVNADNPVGQGPRRIVYPARSGELAVTTRQLQPGPNAISVRYANDAGPDGNFSFALGGIDILSINRLLLEKRFWVRMISCE
jgi:hypothetical protein